MDEKIEKLIENRESYISEIAGAINGVSTQIHDSLRSFHRIEFHNRLQEEISYLAAKYYLYGIKEYQIEDFKEKGWDGFIDVVWATGFGKREIPVVAFEIDSSLRKKSVEKLLAVEAPFRFWVYYGKKEAYPLLEKEDPEGLITLINVERPEFVRS
ncbi:hypothetical protein [Methanosarcina sp. 1.H.A.2.2]|jgi:hypothetical protein|uniref:hypothetical protein n=1 Tax=Methanosarcina sp. 1.H.A.2.2 TaxID=1483601 RepID=UPI000622AB64|nr:hypothetical protein [Methanosarcina sp. 1.H.A.2.2]KKH46862.1 hypothetical protein EO93_02170 [Methanosarcina sp. 1.H.A.2.2]